MAEMKGSLPLMLFLLSLYIFGWQKKESRSLSEIIIFGIFNLIKSLITASIRLSVALFNGLRGGLANFSLGRREVVLAPGDRSPQAGQVQDYWDYRGVAEEQELRALFQGVVRLGHYWHPKRGRGRELFLPIELLYRNCAIVGPPGSGKTESIIVPWIKQLLGAGYSVITVDIKGDLYDRLIGDVQKMGVRIWYWNPGDPSRSLCWNWFDEVNFPRDVEAVALSILGRPKPNDPQPFFYERDYRWLRSLVKLVKQAYGQQAKPSLLYEIAGDQRTIRDILNRYPSVKGLSVELSDLLQFAPDEHSRAVSGLLNALHLFNEPSMKRVSERSDFRLPSVGLAPTLLIVGASLADARAGEVLSSVLLNLLFNFIYRRFSPSGSQKAIPLHLIIDEAPRLKERVNFSEILSIARSAKIGICLAMQDIAQLGDVQEQSAILANCLTIIMLKGSSPVSAKYFSERLGQRVDYVVSQNVYQGPFDLFPQSGRGLQTANVPVLREREIMYPPFGNYFAVAQVSPVSNKPFLLELTLP